MDAGGDALADVLADAPADSSRMPLVPRLLAPLSAGRVSNRRPTLRWVMPTGFAQATAQVCSDRPCTHPLGTWTVAGSSVRPSDPLPAGIVFWRVWGLDSRGVVVGSSATWEFEVPHRDAPVDTSWGVVKDFNNDGYDDVAVGDVNATARGAIHVYFGSVMGLPTSPTMTLSPPVTGADIGGVIAGGGDVNGDGFADLLVGDPEGDGTSGLFVSYLGNGTGDPLVSTPAITGPDGMLGQFGGAVESAGDVNGDGYSDVVVGAPCALWASVAPDYSCGSGVAYLYLGGPAGLATTYVSRILSTERGWIGYSVTSAGDVDGDGYADVLVGNPMYGAAGGAYLYFGGPSGLSMAESITLTYPARQGGYGMLVAGAGDLNGDSLSDFIVSAPNVVTIYLGNRTRSFSSPDQVLTSPDPGDGIPPELYGVQTFAPGDVNGDGYCDLAIGAPCGYLPPTPTSTSFYCAGHGWVYEYPGGTSGVPADPAVTLTSTSAYQFGRTASVIGDVNADGFEDLAVGAPGYGNPDFLGSPNGQMLVFDGRSSGLPTAPDQIFSGIIQFSKEIASALRVTGGWVSVQRLLPSVIGSVVCPDFVTASGATKGGSTS